MKNEHQENGVLRGPLILMVPAFNLVAVMSLDWLDQTDRAAVCANKVRLKLSGNSAENGEGFRGQVLNGGRQFGD